MYLIKNGNPEKVGVLSSVSSPTITKKMSPLMIAMISLLVVGAIVGFGRWIYKRNRKYRV